MEGGESLGGTINETTNDQVTRWWRTRGSGAFWCQAQAVDRDSVCEATLVELQWYIRHPDFEIDKMKHTANQCVVGFWLLA